MHATLDERKILARLTAEELDHLRLGLLHGFGAEIEGQPAAGVWTLVTEDGNRIALDTRTLDVRDAWQTAEAAF